MSIQIRKASLWHDQDDRRVLRHGKLIEQRSECKAIFNKPDFQSAVGTVHVTDWCIVVTDVDGNHHGTEIYDVDSTGETVVVRWPKDNPSIYSQYGGVSP